MAVSMKKHSGSFTELRNLEDKNGMIVFFLRNQFEPVEIFTERAKYRAVELVR